MNPLDQERDVRKAIESLHMAANHIQNSTALDPETKEVARKELDKVEKAIILSWANGLAA